MAAGVQPLVNWDLAWVWQRRWPIVATERAWGYRRTTATLCSPFGVSCPGKETINDRKHRQTSI